MKFLAYILIFAVYLLIAGTIGALCWTYTLNTWLIFFGKAASVEWWHGALIGFIPGIGQTSIPLVVITWILMLFLL